jgi:hypothetical protein
MEEVLEELRESKQFRSRVIPAVENGPSQDSDVTSGRRSTPADATSEAGAQGIPEIQPEGGGQESISTRQPEDELSGSLSHAGLVAELPRPPSSPFEIGEVGASLEKVDCETSL